MSKGTLGCHALSECPKKSWILTLKDRKWLPEKMSGQEQEAKRQSGKFRNVIAGVHSKDRDEQLATIMSKGTLGCHDPSQRSKKSSVLTLKDGKWPPEEK